MNSNNQSNQVSTQYVWTIDNSMYCGNRANIEAYLAEGLIKPLVVNPKPVITNKALVALILDSAGFTTFINAQTDNQTWIASGMHTPTISTLRELLARWLSPEYFDVSFCPNGAKCITIIIRNH